MNNDLEKVREIFLSEVDEETRADKETKIEEWERDLRESEAMAEWREHDITKKIAAQAKEDLQGDWIAARRQPHAHTGAACFNVGKAGRLPFHPFADRNRREGAHGDDPQRDQIRAERRRLGKDQLVACP